MNNRQIRCEHCGSNIDIKEGADEALTYELHLKNECSEVPPRVELVLNNPLAFERGLDDTKHYRPE